MASILEQIIDMYIEADWRWRISKDKPNSAAHRYAGGELTALGKVIHILTGMDNIDWVKLVDERRKDAHR